MKTSAPNTPTRLIPAAYERYRNLEKFINIGLPDFEI
jgi:hypothetical protein